MFGKLANRALRTVGLKLERVEDRGWYVGGVADRVSTLIDVGAAYGTPPFYALHPHADLFLIDPVAEYEASFRDILTRRRGGYEITALGDETGSIVMNVQVDHLTKSSILEHTRLTRLSGRVERREVPLKRLDDVVREHALRPPFGVKIDAEGFELKVVLGAEETLAASEFLIVEVSVQKRFEGSCGLADFIDEMRRRGFGVANILSANPDRQGLVRFMDVLFIPEGRSWLPKR